MINLQFMKFHKYDLTIYLFLLIKRFKIIKFKKYLKIN